MNKFFYLSSACLLNKPKTKAQTCFIYKQTNMNEQINRVKPKFVYELLDSFTTLVMWLLNIKSKKLLISSFYWWLYGPLIVLRDSSKDCEQCESLITLRSLLDIVNVVLWSICQDLRLVKLSYF